MEMALGYPIEAQAANSIERNKDEIKKWKYSKDIFLTNQGEEREAPNEGEVFIQKESLQYLKKIKLTQRKKLFLKEKTEKKQFMKHTKDFMRVISQMKLLDLPRNKED